MENPTVHIQQLENIEWLDGSGCGYTLSNSNDVWRICISSTIPHINDFWALLSADEQERAQRYYREKDKQRFIVSRGALRILLGKYLDIAPGQIIFEIGENKKPHVKGGTGLHYNVSHSGDRVLIAVSYAEVGIDVEKPDFNLHYNDIMQISYSEAEIKYVDQSANPVQSFYTLWTRKEAILKATAKGIDDGLKFIPGIEGSHTVAADVIGSTKSWIVSSFKIDHQHIASIASAYPKNSFWEMNF